MANELGNLVVRIGADTTNFTEGVGRLNQQIRLFQSRMAASNSTLNSSENSFNRLRQTAISLSQQYNLQNQRLDALRQAHVQLVAAQGADSRAAQEMEIRINRQVAALNRLEAEIIQANTQLRLQSTRWYQASTAMAVASTRMKKAGEAMAKAGRMMTMYITTPIVAAGVASVKMASDTNESLNKVEVAFKESAGAVKDFSKTTLNSYGIARGTSLDMAALFGDMATSMGISTSKASEMSMRLVGLAGDLRSYKNISIDVAKTALNSIFTGETESIKMLGVVMTEAALQEYAFAQGIKTKVNAMSQSEKVMLRYNFVLDKTKNSQNDFKNTYDSTANQMSVFKESLKELGDTIGQKLLPTITPMIKKLNELVEKFAKLKPQTQETIIKFAAFAAAIGPVLVVVGSLVSAIGSIVGVLGSTAGAIAGAGGLGTVLATFATGPVGVTLGAVGGLTLAFIALKKAFGDTATPIEDFNARNSRFGAKYQVENPNRVTSYNNDDIESSRLNISKSQNKTIPKSIPLPTPGKKDTTTFDQAVDNYDYLAHMDKLNYKEQLSYLQNILKKYASTTEEKRKIEMMLFDLKKDHVSQLSKDEKKALTAAQKKFNAEVALYNSKVKAGKLSYAQETKMLNDIKSKYAKDTQEKAKIDAMLYTLKKNHESALQKQKDANMKKQQAAYDNQLTALEKIQKLFDKNKEDKANNQHVAQLQDRINRASDPLEKAGIQNELNKFKSEMGDRNTSNIFDLVRDNIINSKDIINKSKDQIAVQAKAATAAMNEVYKQLSNKGFNMNTGAALAGSVPSTNYYNVTIDAKNVKEFNDVVTIVKKLPTAAKKNVR